MEYEGADMLRSSESDEFTRTHDVTRLMDVTGSDWFHQMSALVWALWRRGCLICVIIYRSHHGKRSTGISSTLLKLP